MKDEHRFILAIVLSALILIGFQHFRVKSAAELHPPVAAVVANDASSSSLPNNQTVAGTKPVLPVAASLALRNRDEILKESPRLAIVTHELQGSINLKGAMLDDLKLALYHEGLGLDTPPITLLSPSGASAPHTDYHAEFGWLSDTASQPMPTADTLWSADTDHISTDHSVLLIWDNGKGLTFERTIAVDDNFMFTITDRVHNNSDQALALYPYGLITRQGDPTLNSKSSVVQEGPLGVVAGTLNEYKYAKLIKDKKSTLEGEGGWLGITDKYWLTAIVPQHNEKITANFSASSSLPVDAKLTHFQADYRGSSMPLAAHSALEHTTLFFAGAKRVKLLDHYAKIYSIERFDRAIDFGWFWFLAKPFLYFFDILGHTFGSFGIAILVITVILKLITLPLSLKSYHAMARMKALQPELARIQARYAEDKAQQGKEMMAFYAREKISPMSGCMPTLIQIPIFFALYKVLYVSLELRHAPFYGWIKDMSAPDPTSLFTLFGLIPWTPPSMLQFGVWPVLMALSMFLQQRLSPQPPDKAQAQMFMMMPIMFMFIMGQAPAGLVIYWTWSNLLGIVQQWYIMRNDARKKLAVIS